MPKILVVEDELELATSIRDWLLLEKHRVDVCNSGLEASLVLKENVYDIVILDVMLPGMNGFEVCRSYRRNGGAARILMVTAKNAISDKENGLDSGADDYITKPFDLKEISARVRALMRRSLDVHSTNISLSDLVIEVDLHRVTRGGEEIKLLPQEFNLLEFLMRNQNRIFSAEALIQRVWHGNSSVNTVRTHIKTLRKKVDGKNSVQLIRTIHGVGYSISDN